MQDEAEQSHDVDTELPTNISEATECNNCNNSAVLDSSTAGNENNVLVGFFKQDVS